MKCQSGAEWEAFNPAICTVLAERANTLETMVPGIQALGYWLRFLRFQDTTLIHDSSLSERIFSRTVSAREPLSLLSLSAEVDNGNCDWSGLQWELTDQSFYLIQGVHHPAYLLHLCCLEFMQMDQIWINHYLCGLGCSRDFYAYICKNTQWDKCKFIRLCFWSASVCHSIWPWHQTFCIGFTSVFVYMPLYISSVYLKHFVSKFGLAFCSY